MRNSFAVIVLLSSSLVACQSPQPEKVSVTTEKKTTEKAGESIRTNLSFLNDFNALEEIFTNDNWLISDKKDSSYFYFSRLGKFTVNTYEYKIVKGDSARVTHALIQTEGDKISLPFNGHKLYIQSATKARLVCTVAGADSLTYTFVRLNDNQISLTYPGNKKTVVKKMLPLSQFLIRSRYDYTNGTKYAFDTSQFIKR